MINKNAVLRYETLNKCLSSRRGHSISELVEACNESYRKIEGMETVTVKKRQVLYDLEDMEEIYGVQIQRERDPEDGRKVLFSYPDGARDIHGERLLDSDYGEFNQALWLLESLVGLPYVKKAADTLKKKIKPDEGGDAPVFAVETNPGLANFDKLGPLFHDIRRKEPIKVTYNASYEKEMVFWFQPYYLKQYNSRWFLFGWDYDGGRVLNLAIDRIVKLDHNKPAFAMYHTYRPNDIDFEHFFDDIIGVTHIPDKKKEHITMKIHDKKDWNRLLTKPIHKSQKLMPDECEMSLDVIPNHELYSTLSQFEKLEILSPENVREEYMKRIEGILELHRRK